MFSDRDYNRPSSRSAFRPPQVSMVTAILFATVGTFLLQVIWSRADGSDPVTDFLCLHAESVRHGQVWRLLTYALVHGGFWHIFVNMWGLFLFGRLLEQRLGRGRFLALYVVSGLIGAGTWLLLNWNSPVPVVGASGSLFGVMMAAAMLFPDVRVMLLIPPVPLKLKTFVAVYAVAEVFLELGGSFARLHDNVAHIAHLGGLLGGFLFMQHHLPRYNLSRLFSRIPNPFRRTWKLHPKPSPGAPGSAAGGDTMHDVDSVLDKIGREGINSLTEAERSVLERARERLRQR